MKISPFLAAIPFFWIGGTSAPDARTIDPNLLTGNISLNLKHGVWKLWEEKPTFQDIAIDLSCDRGKCQPSAWGYAPKFNREVDHRGTVTTTSLGNSWRLKVNMKIQSHPWSDEVRDANYDIDVVLYKGTLLGSYSGNLGERELQNKVTGGVSPAWPTPVADHRPLDANEHPRLIFRASELDTIRQRAKTPIGRRILAELDKSLTEKIYYDGYVPNGGYHAAGYCFLALLNSDRQKADIAWGLVQKSRANPGRRILEHSAIVAGVGLAYDLCYNLWTQDRRREITGWLSSEGKKLLRGGSPRDGWNGDAGSNWNARARGAGGLAMLAILGESLPEDTLYSPDAGLEMAKRQVKRYFDRSVGNGGFGTEGDHYTTEPMIISVFPFLQAYRNVTGEDLVTGSPAAALIPHYLTRAVPRNGELFVPPYGRHGRFMGVSVFSMGVGLVPETEREAIRWRLDGMKLLFDPYYPQVAPFLLASYPLDRSPLNPEKVLNRVLVDEDKGFYAFRNGWRDENDFIASIYLKRLVLGGWSYPDAGSIRIWGLGSHWATIDNAEKGRDRENVVILPDTRPWGRSKPLAFRASPTGSGSITLQTDTIGVKGAEPPANITGVRSFAVDYSGASGSPGLFVLLDAFVGGIDEPAFRGRTWVMNTEGNVTLAKNGFSIAGRDGATLRATFITPASPRLQLQKTANGTRILARGADDFLVVMTVQKGEVPKVTATGIGKETRITVGKQEISIDNGVLKLARE